MKSTAALAATLGLDASEMGDYQYQAGQFSRAIYSVDMDYFCLGKMPPKPEAMRHLAGLVWEKHPDQFWATKYKTVIWRAHSR